MINPGIVKSVSLTGASSGDGAVLDGVTSSIRGTVVALASSSAQAVAIVDGTGTQITSFGGGTQYATGTATGAPTGTVALGWDGANVKALPLDGSGFLKVNVAAGASSGTQYADGTARGTATGTLAMVDDGTNIQSMAGDTTGKPNMNLFLGGIAAQLKDDTQFGDGVGSGIASTANRVYNGATYDRVLEAFDADGMGTSDAQLRVGATTRVYNGATWDRLRGDTTNGAYVNVKAMIALPAGTAIIGKVGIDQTTPGTTNLVALTAETTKVIGVTRSADGAGNLLTSTGNALDINLKTSSITLPVSLSSTTITGTVAVTQSTSPWVVSLTSTTITGTVAVTQSTSPWVVSLASTTVTGTVAVTQSTSPWLVGGDVASGVADSGNPVKIGGVGNSSAPSAVTAGQRVNSWYGLLGQQVVTFSSSATASGDAVNNQLGVITTAGTASTLPLGVFPVVFNGTNADRIRSVQALNTTGGATQTGILAAGNIAQFDDTSPVSITEDNFGNVRMSKNRNIYTNIRDGTGLEFGASVDIQNRLSVVSDELRRRNELIYLQNYAMFMNSISGSYGYELIGYQI